MKQFPAKEKQLIVGILKQYDFQGIVVYFVPGDRRRGEFNLAYDLQLNPRGVLGGMEMTDKIEEALGKKVTVSDSRIFDKPNSNGEYDDLKEEINNGEVIYDKG